MPLSYNGWSASPDASLIGIERFLIGRDTYVYLRKTAAPVLVWMANYWDSHIEDIDTGQQDDWGWNYRETRGGGSLSNHASGTALDINALRYPRGTNNMPAAKQRQVMDLCALVNRAAGKTLVLWGGLWSGEYKDQMHLELASGTDANDVARAYKNLTTETDWLTTVDKDAVRSLFDNRIEAAIPAIVDAVVGDLSKKLANTDSTLAKRVRNNIRLAVQDELVDERNKANPGQ